MGTASRRFDKGRIPVIPFVVAVERLRNLSELFISSLPVDPGTSKGFQVLSRAATWYPTPEECDCCKQSQEVRSVEERRTGVVVLQIPEYVLYDEVYSFADRTEE